MVATKPSLSGASQAVAASQCFIYLCGVSTASRGAAWVAIMLRQLRDCGCLAEVRHLPAASAVRPGALTAAVIVLAADPALLGEQTELLQQLPAPRTLAIVTGSNLDAAHALLLRESGAATIVDSVATAQAAARLVQRFLATIRPAKLGRELTCPGRRQLDY